MTISLSDNNPRVSYTVAEGATETAFTVNFEFFDDADLNFYVDGTLKTLTTHYTVTGGSGATGTINTTAGNSVTGIAGGSTVVITRSIAFARTTDFPSSGAFEVATLNTELDRFTAIAADINDDTARSIHLADDDEAVSTQLPLKSDRVGKVLGFNATTGAVEAGPTIADVSSLAQITTDISTLADIEDGTDATDAIQTVAGISSNVTTVAGISSNVTTVAGISSDVTAVVADQADIGTVATNIASVNTVATNIADVITVANDLNEAVSELETVANDLNEATSEIDTVANSISNVDTVGTNIANVNTVAGNNANVTTVAGISANVTTVAGISGNVSTVAGISSDVTTVAADGTDIGTVATNITNVNTVAGISGNVTTVAGISANVTSVAGNATNINTVAGDTTAINAVASDATDIGTVATNIANVNTVAGISANVTTVAGDTANIGTLATNLNGTDTIGTVAGSISNVNSVGGSITNVNTVATNLASVNSFANTYRIGATDPTTSLDTGDLFYNTTSSALKVYTGSAWEQGVTAGSGFLPLSGGGLTGNLTFGDGNEIRMGASNDLVIEHDGSNSYISDNGTGNLFIGATNLFLRSATGETYVGAIQDGAVSLYHDNNAKLATTSLGIDVTGKGVFSTANPDVNGLKITATTGTNASAMTFSNTATAYVGLDNSVGGRISGVPYGLAVWNGSAYPVVFGTNGSERMRIDASGNLFVGNTAEFVDGSGTGDTGIQINPIGLTISTRNGGISGIFGRQASDGDILQFRKDGSAVGSIGVNAGRLYIGSTAGNDSFVTFTGDEIYPATSTGSGRDNAINLGTSGARFKDLYLSNSVRLDGATRDISIQQDNYGLRVYDNDASSERFRITAAGKVGISTSSPAEALSVNGNMRLQTGNNPARIQYFNSTGTYSVGSSGGASISFHDVSGSQEISFETHYSGNSHAERVRITKEGNLTVTGNISATTGTFTNGDVNVTGTGNRSVNITSSSGLGSMEIGGSSGAFIDLKQPSSDDFDIRLGTSGTGGYLSIASGSFTFSGGVVNSTSGYQINGVTLQPVTPTSGSPSYYGARAFANMVGDGAVSIRNSQNVSSITDEGTGKYRVNFSTAMPDANFTCVSQGSWTNANTNDHHPFVVAVRGRQEDSHNASWVKMSSGTPYQPGLHSGVQYDADTVEVAIFR